MPRDLHPNLGVLRMAAAALAMAAGFIHLAVTPEHFEEAVSFGLFMLIVGVAQLLVGLLLVIHPSRPLIFAALLGTAAVFGVFAIAYTVGLPLGPHPGEAEEMGPAVILSKGIELGLLLILAYLSTRPSDAADGLAGSSGSASRQP